ncbi:MAG: DUF4190 domain-containing protein [Acutalibacteraceae bacterium]
MDNYTPDNQNNFEAQDYQSSYVDYNAGTQEVAPPKKGYAITSLVLGIVSMFCCGVVTGIISLVFGILFIKGSKPGDEGRGMAIAGVVLSIIAIVFYLIYFIVYCLVLGNSLQDMANMNQFTIS